MVSMEAWPTYTSLRSMEQGRLGTSEPDLRRASGRAAQKPERSDPVLSAVRPRADRQLALMNFSIEAGILLRGNGVSHAMLDIYVLLARGLPDAIVSQPTQLPHSYTHTRS